MRRPRERVVKSCRPLTSRGCRIFTVYALLRLAFFCISRESPGHDRRDERQEHTRGHYCLLAAPSPSCLSHSIELAMVTPSFLGGALSFKGDKKTKAKKKRRKAKAKYHIDEEKKKERIKPQSVPDDDYDDELTEAERKALKYKLEKERNDLERVAAKSHRERVEEFNEKLGQLTEHNDIPRVSQEKGMATSTSNDFVGILIIRLFVYLFYRSALLEMVRASMGQIQGTTRCRLMMCYGILIHVNEHYNRNEPHK